MLQIRQKDTLNVSEPSNEIFLDSSLAAKVVKMTNSPMYELRQLIVKLLQPSGLLGVNAVPGLVLSFSLPRMAGSETRKSSLSEYWGRSVISANATQEIWSCKRLLKFYGMECETRNFIVCQDAHHLN